MNVEEQNEKICCDLYNCFQTYITKILDASYTKPLQTPKQQPSLYLYPTKINPKTSRKSPIMIALEREIHNIITSSILPPPKPVVSVEPTIQAQTIDQTNTQLQDANNQLQKLQNQIKKLRLDYFKELNIYHSRRAEDDDFIEVKYFDATDGLDDDTREIMNSRIRMVKNTYNEMAKKLLQKIKGYEETIYKYSLLTPKEYGLINMPIDQIFMGVAKLCKDKDLIWKCIIGAYGQEWIDSIIEENYGDIKHCEQILEDEFLKLKDKVQSALNPIIESIQKEKEVLADANEQLRVQISKDKLSKATDIELARYEIETTYKDKINNINKEWEDKMVAMPDSKEKTSVRLFLQIWKYKGRAKGLNYDTLDKIRRKKLLYKYQLNEAIKKCERLEREITNLSNEISQVKGDDVTNKLAIQKLRNQIQSQAKEGEAKDAEIAKCRQIIKEKMNQFTIASPVKGHITMLLSERILQELHEFNRLKRLEYFKSQTTMTEICDIKKEVIIKSNAKQVKLPCFHGSTQTIEIKYSTITCQTQKEKYTIVNRVGDINFKESKINTFMKQTIFNHYNSNSSVSRKNSTANSGQVMKPQVLADKNISPMKRQTFMTIETNEIFAYHSEELSAKFAAANQISEAIGGAESSMSKQEEERDKVEQIKDDTIIVEDEPNRLYKLRASNSIHASIDHELYEKALNYLTQNNKDEKKSRPDTEKYYINAESLWYLADYTKMLITKQEDLIGGSHLYMMPENKNFSEFHNQKVAMIH